MASTKYVLLLSLTFLAGCCLGQDVNCTEGDLRLYNMSTTTPDHGMLQRCNAYDQWEAVCNYDWDCVDAMVACRQLGFNDSRPTVFPDGYSGTWDSMYDHYYSCSSGSYTSLQDCGKSQSSVCYVSNYPNRMAALACNSPLANCARGDLRLVGGESDSEGRVEVCYKGGWYSVCGIDDDEASVMCKQLGHTEYPESVVFDDSRFGQTPPAQGYVQLSCSSSSLPNKWTDCTVANPTCNECGGDAIKCFTPPECEEGNLRLVNGTIDNEGRVEVCLQGVWGTVCSSSGWSAIDGYVACKKLNLGSSGKSPVVYTGSSVYGDGNQRQVMYSPSCNGWEKSLTDCSYTTDFSCPRVNTAGLLCFDDCEDSEIRLVGGASDSEGTVEVCVDKLWGLVGDTGWSLTDARVVCRQLGFPTDAAQELPRSKYGKPRKPAHWSNVNCNGDEQQLASCEHHSFTSLEEKKTVLNVINAAGVKCLPTSSETPAMNGSMGNTSADSSEQTLSVLIAPAYLTMLMEIASLVLSIVILGMLLLKRTKEPMDSKKVTKSDSIPMTTRDTTRYTVGQQHRSTTPATTRPSAAASHAKAATSYPTKAATSYPSKAPSSYPATSTLPSVTPGSLPSAAAAADKPPPLPQPRCPTVDETEPMYEVTDMAGEGYMDMA